MSDWKTYKLKEITTKIGSGATPRGGKDAYLESGDYSLIRSQNVLDFTFSYNGLAFINLEQASQLNNVTLEERDVLLNITGDSVARVCQVPNEVLPARVNQHVAIIRPDTSKLSPEFLKYYLLNPKCKNQLLSFSAVGATRNALTKGMIEDLEIQIPSIDEQQRIASILSSLDDKIELNRQTNQTLETIAQTLFQEMCVPKGEELPEGWRVGKLGEIYKTTSGGTPSRAKMEYYENGTINWVKSKELGSFYVLETEEKITDIALKNSSAKLLPENSILMAMYGATVAEISILGEPATCNQAICAILPNDNYPYSYVYEFLKDKRDEIKSMAVGAAQQNISQVVIQGIEMIIPTDEIVSNFHKRVEPIYLQIKNNIQENQTLIALRDSLLPKLMKGEIEI